LAYESPLPLELPLTFLEMGIDISAGTTHYMEVIEWNFLAQMAKTIPQ